MRGDLCVIRTTSVTAHNALPLQPQLPGHPQECALWRGPAGVCRSRGQQVRLNPTDAARDTFSLRCYMLHSIEHGIAHIAVPPLAGNYK